jgi:hypothetical protein
MTAEALRKVRRVDMVGVGNSEGRKRGEDFEGQKYGRVAG